MQEPTCSDCSSASRATTRLLVPPVVLLGVPGRLSAGSAGAPLPWRSRLPGRPPERLADSCDLSLCSGECCPASLPSTRLYSRATLTCEGVTGTSLHSLRPLRLPEQGPHSLMPGSKSTTPLGHARSSEEEVAPERRGALQPGMPQNMHAAAQPAQPAHAPQLPQRHPSSASDPVVTAALPGTSYAVLCCAVRARRVQEGRRVLCIAVLVPKARK